MRLFLFSQSAGRSAFRGDCYNNPPLVTRKEERYSLLLASRWDSRYGRHVRRSRRRVNRSAVEEVGRLGPVDSYDVRGAIFVDCYVFACPAEDRKRAFVGLL